MSPQFFVAICQPGFEAELKAEIAKKIPYLKPSFQKKGLITLKLDSAEKPNFSSLIFPIWVGKVTRFLGPHDPNIKVSLRYHSEIENWESSGGFTSHDEVLQIEVDSETALQAVSVSHQKLIPYPGNVFPEKYPPNAPSRAYLKWAEAQTYLKSNLIQNRAIIEIACSPGGGSLFFLEYGAFVFGVDPREIDPILRQHKEMFYLQKMAKNIKFVDYPQTFPPPSLVAMDMNLDPELALQEWAHVVRTFPTIQESWIILKLGKKQGIDIIESYQKEIEHRGWTLTFAKQLRSNKKEIFLAAQKKGLPL